VPVSLLTVADAFFIDHRQGGAPRASARAPRI
jgi:hypothetical protein